MTKSMMEGAVESLFSETADREERYAAAYFLLLERERLTAQGMRGVVKALKALSDQDFGQDYEAWRSWLLDQI